MSIEANTRFLKAIEQLLGRRLTVAECYIAYALRDGKYQFMSEVPPLPKDESRGRP